MIGDFAPFLKTNWTPSAVGIWILIFMFCVYALREYRETRKLSSADRQARREGYETQVQLLTGENRALASDLSQLRVEYDQYRRDCHAENDALRNMIIRLENEVAGFKRRADTLSIEIAKDRGIDVRSLPDGREPNGGQGDKSGGV